MAPRFANADGLPALYPLACLFRFAGGPFPLLAVQAVGTELAAWGVARTALALQLGEWTAVLGAVLLLLAPGILGGGEFDYHPDVIALPFWCGRPWPAWRDDRPPAECLPSRPSSARNSPRATGPRHPVDVPHQSAVHTGPISRSSIGARIHNRARNPGRADVRHGGCRWRTPRSPRRPCRPPIQRPGE